MAACLSNILIRSDPIDLDADHNNRQYIETFNVLMKLNINSSGAQLPYCGDDNRPWRQCGHQHLQNCPNKPRILPLHAKCSDNSIQWCLDVSFCCFNSQIQMWKFGRYRTSTSQYFNDPFIFFKSSWRPDVKPDYQFAFRSYSAHLLWWLAQKPFFHSFLLLGLSCRWASAQLCNIDRLAISIDFNQRRRWEWCENAGWEEFIASKKSSIGYYQSVTIDF